MFYNSSSAINSPDTHEIICKINQCTVCDLNSDTDYQDVGRFINSTYIDLLSTRTLIYG